MFVKPKRLQFVQEAAAQILDSPMPSGCAVTICARRGGLACAGSVWRHALQVSDDRNVEGEDCLSHEATMKRLELTIGDLPRCWMPWTWRLSGRWRSLGRRQLRYHPWYVNPKSVAQARQFSSEPGGFFFACGARATYSGGVAQPFSCDSTFRTIRATGLLSADCGANLIWAKVTIPRATTRSAPDAAMRGRYFTGTSF
ncbi:hypothetical protein R54767_05299 [Paraburkholderia gardini]|uniref:Uncharacterized protein n=1 Tax=Paraburkholderia gardini TaxID=2823469 RepID=A0ABM8UBG5_9BURK|nr:hypothetical protein R54767_05299 [Paraburkholderia gardini]